MKKEITTTEVVNYIIANNSFKRDEVIEELNITRSKFSEIINILDEKQILVRWENNSRVWNYNLSYKEMLFLLQQEEKQKLEEIRKEINDPYTLDLRYS